MKCSGYLEAPGLPSHCGPSHCFAHCLNTNRVGTGTVIPLGFLEIQSTHPRALTGDTELQRRVWTAEVLDCSSEDSPLNSFSPQ